MIIGISTGSLYKHLDPSSKEAIQIIQETNAKAIELCGTLSERFDKTKKIIF